MDTMSLARAHADNRGGGATQRKSLLQLELAKFFCTEPYNVWRVIEWLACVAANDRVALAARGFEALPVEDGDKAAGRLDEPGASERAEGFRHSGTSDAEHEREKLVRERKRVGAADTVVRQEQPTRASLDDSVEAITRRRLRDLRHERVGASRDHVPESWKLLHRGLERVGGHASGVAGNLHERLGNRNANAKK